MTKEFGPFEPGEGRLPPYLAGRESEQETLRAFVGRLRLGTPAPSNVALYGPRGNGKTALMGWLEEDVAAGNAGRQGENAEIETLWLTPPKTPTVGKLIERVARLSWLQEWWKRLGVTVGVPGVVGASMAQASDAGLPALEDALSDRLRKKSLIILFDEAHNLDPDVGHALLNAAQEVGRNAPLLVVLAGTPDLEDRLDGMQVSFWDRAARLRLGRLSEEASAEAIRRPLADDGVAIADALLAAAYEENHGYPFFVQHWGQELWQRAKGHAAVTATDVSEAREAVDAIRQTFYDKRYREMERLGLLRVAHAVAEAFRAPPPAGDEDGFEAQPHLENRDLRSAIRRGLGNDFTAERAVDAGVKLRHLGYIWPTGFRATWEPGIPSLMAYMWSVVRADLRD